MMGDAVNEEVYISLTEIAKYKNSDNVFNVVVNWMRNHSAISFLGLWEQIHNPNFKPIEFDRFKAVRGENAFALIPKQWMQLVLYQNRGNMEGLMLIQTLLSSFYHEFRQRLSTVLSKL